MKKQFTTLLIVIVLVIFGVFIGQSFHSESQPSVKSNVESTSTTVQVSQFYNGQDGYSLSIPSGNRSTCVWTYAAGSGDIPYSKTTYAQTATEKHIINFSDEYDFKVTCIDDFGNQYIGIFPSSTQ